MNKICHYMEKSLTHIRTNTRTSVLLIRQMQHDPDTQFKDSDIEMMDDFFTRYRKAKLKKQKIAQSIDSTNGGDNQSRISATSFDQFCSMLRKEIIRNIDGDIKYIVDLAIHCCYIRFRSRPKAFVWDLFGNQIVENLREKSAGTITVPYLDDKNGTLPYLGKKYSLLEVQI